MKTYTINTPPIVYEGEPVTIIQRHTPDHVWVQNEQGTRWFVAKSELTEIKTLRTQWQFDGKFTYKGAGYVKGINDHSAIAILNEVEPIQAGMRVYVWDPYKVWRASRDRPRGGDYVGGRAHGTVMSVQQDTATVQYDDLTELIEEQINDLRIAN